MDNTPKLQARPSFRYSKIRQKGSQSTLTTVVLAGILVGTLIGAQILVTMRNVPAAAINNAADLVEQVTDQGLNQYLSRSRVSYYAVEDSEGQKGYSIRATRPVRDESGRVRIVGRYMEYIDNTYYIDTFWVAEDLSEYSYKQEIEDISQGATRTIIQRKKDDAIRISYSTSMQGYIQSLPANTVSVFHDNLIPPPLLSLFVSLSRDAGNSKGSAFVYPHHAPTPNYVDVEWLVCWARPTADVPEEVARDYPQARAVKTQWRGIAMNQYYLFDDQHQIVWEKDRIPERELILTETPRAALLADFPAAQNIIQEYFSNYDTASVQEIL